MTYKTITLCGSLKFEEVLSITKGEHKTPPTTEEKSILDKVHYKKIMLSDCIIVVNPGFYIGDSTRNEIEFAKLTNKEIFYLYDCDNSILWNSNIIE